MTIGQGQGCGRWLELRYRPIRCVTPRPASMRVACAAPRVLGEGCARIHRAHRMQCRCAGNLRTTSVIFPSGEMLKHTTNYFCPDDRAFTPDSLYRSSSCFKVNSYRIGYLSYRSGDAVASPSLSRKLREGTYGGFVCSERAKRSDLLKRL